MSPCLFNFYAEYIIRNAGLDEIPAFPGEEHYVLDKSLDEVYFADSALHRGNQALCGRSFTHRSVSIGAKNVPER